MIQIVIHVILGGIIKMMKDKNLLIGFITLICKILGHKWAKERGLESECIRCGKKRIYNIEKKQMGSRLTC
jgi:hypothetical protein